VSGVLAVPLLLQHHSTRPALLSFELLNFPAEHLLSAVRSTVDSNGGTAKSEGAAAASDGSGSGSMEELLQHFLLSAVEKHCTRSGASHSPADVLATLSNWFVLLQSPVLAPRDQQLFEVVATQVVESPHPYLDSSDLTHSIRPSDESLTGSIEYMEVSFDPRCRTEKDCDYVTFFQGELKQGLQKYTGRDPGVWAGVGPTEVLKVKGSSMEARFHSDSSNNDWGYKFTVSFFAKISVETAPFYKVISPIMACLPLMHLVSHGLHGDAITLMPNAACKRFAMYLKVLGSLSDVNIQQFFREDRRNSLIHYLTTLVQMKCLGHCDEASMHSLFKRIYLLACAAAEDLFLPSSCVDDEMIAEIGSVISDHLTDSNLRAMIEKAFVKAAAVSSPSPSSSAVLFAVLARAIDCSSRASSQESARKNAACSCPNDHPMMLCSSVPLAIMRTVAAWRCSQCSKSIPLFETGVWYCETCS
jgi:hypothetical protein